jgi:N-methylhydantoinase A
MSVRQRSTGSPAGPSSGIVSCTERICHVAILGIDVGGTFTDAVLLDGDELRTAKVPTAARQEESVVAAARAVGVGDVDRFTHGTTVATNALLERKGARTAFVATAGFEHLLHLRRQNRAHLYRLCVDHPEPLVPLDRCFGVKERIGPDGVLEELDLDSLPAIDADAVAVCLLFSFRDASHERAVADELRRLLPSARVVASHEVSPEFREYERASTTAVDAYLGPVVSSYLERLAAACSAAGLPEPLVMRSSGGVATVVEAAAHPSWALVSGPAAGVVGAELVSGRAGQPDAISFDMGGTSTDVCLIAGGSTIRSAERSVDGLPVRLPTVDLQTVGAGGGSIVWRDAGGALRVGPESAGADPGPACYGRGGTRPTVTDANLLLGRLPERLAGGLELDRAAAERALDGIDPGAVIAAVNAEMLRAVRLVSVERGHDPRGFALVAFGGAGPLHACELAEEVGIETVLVPDAAGVLSALGLVASDERRDSVRSYVRPLAEAGELPDEGEADLRYRGQSFELSVPLGDGLAERFHHAHAERYGYADREREIELVAVRTADVRPGPEVRLPPGEALEATGPQLLELPGATCWLPPGWVGVRDGGTLRLTRK